MASPVFIDFVARGIPEVQRAFRSIGQFVIGSEQESTRAVKRGVDAKEAEYKRLQRDIKRWRKEELAEAEAALAKQRRDEKRSNAERLANERRVSRELSRLRNDIQRSYDRDLRMEVSAQERAAKDRLATEKRVNAEMRRLSRDLQKDFDRDRKEESRIQAREDAKRRRDADKNARIGTRTAKKAAGLLEDQEWETYGRRQQFANTIVGAGGRAFGKATGAVASLARGAAGTMLQLGGGFSMHDAIKGQLEFERKSALLSNATNMPGKGVQRVPTALIMANAKEAAAKAGYDPTEMVAGLTAFTARTGNYKKIAAGDAEFYGQVAKATDSSLKDVMGTAGQLVVQNREMSKDEQLGPQALKQLILSIVMQARQGSVEFDQLAKAGGVVTRSSVSWAGNQAENQRKLLGLAQIGMRTTGGDVRESATSISNLSSDVSDPKKRAAFEQIYGGKYLNSKGQIVPGQAEFIGRLLEGVGGDVSKLKAAGITKRSIKTIEALAPTYLKAEADALADNKTKMEARAEGRKAVIADVDEVTATSYSVAEMGKDFAEVMKTSAEQFEGAVRELRVQIGEQLMPEFAKMIPILKDSLPAIKEFVTSLTNMAHWATENPFKGFSALVTGFFIKELAGVGIAQLMKNAIAGAAPGGVPTGGVPGMPGMPGVGSGPGGVPGAPGAAPAGGGLLAPSLITLGIGAQLGSFSSTADIVAGGYMKGGKQVEEAIALAKAGKTEEAQALLDRSRGRSLSDKAGAYVGIAARGAEALVSPANIAARAATDWFTGNEEIARIQKTIADSQVASNQELITAIRANTAATVASTHTSGPGGPPMSKAPSKTSGAPIATRNPT